MDETSPIPKFAVMCLFVLVGFGALLGWIVTRSLEHNTVLMSNRMTAEFVAGEVQREFAAVDELTIPKVGPDYDRFTEKVRHLNFGPYVKRVKIWNRDRTVIWSDEQRLIGKRFPDNEHLDQALAGQVASEISLLDKDENKYERGFERLLELYVPISFHDGGGIQVVFEIYQDLDFLYAEISHQQRAIWISILFGFLVIYLTLLGTARLLRRECVKTMDT